MLRLFKISLEDALHICDKSQYYESSSWEKALLKFRCLWCANTRHYVDRNNKLTKTLKVSKLECLNDSERKLLEERLREQLKNKM